MKAFFQRLAALAHKETLHISRDAQVIYMALGMPMVLLLLFGYAISFDLNSLPIGLVDQDQSPASRRLVQSITASDTFSIAEHLPGPEAVEEGFARAQFKAALLIPPGYSKTLKRASRADVQLLLDGADGTTAGIALGYMANIVQAESIRIQGGSAQELILPIEARVRARFNQGMKSALFIVPGLIALILSIMAVMLTALTVAREWERGSMEQLFSTPVGRLEVVLGKLAPYVVLGLIQVMLVVALGLFVFDVPFKGAMLDMFLVSILFLACMLGQGLLISVVTRNQMVATQVAAISSMLPTILLSGFMFPIENMPSFLQALSLVVPARYYIVAMRGIMLKGNDLTLLWPQALALFIFAGIMVLASTARFKRRLD